MYTVHYTVIAGLYSDALKEKAGELWETIVRLETEKYDLQERQKRQDYDVSIYFTLSLSPHSKYLGLTVDK